MGFKAKSRAPVAPEFTRFDEGGAYWDAVHGKSFADPWEIVCAHIGMYLKWCLHRGWAGDEHRQNTYGLAAVKSLLAGKSTGTEFLIVQCDTKFCSHDLSEEGAAFTAHYY